MSGAATMRPHSPDADRPLVKVCGLTRVDDALACAELGVDLIGLNFYPPSPRALSPAAARSIADAVRGEVDLVGVFVNEAADRVETIASEVGLDRLQFHGDEEPAFVARFGRRALPVFRLAPDAKRFDSGRLAPYPSAWGFLFDVADREAYGGTGRRWSYGAVRSLPADRPTFIAGGVTPQGARSALEASGCGGVDVCSGVESAPGVKDRRAIATLVREVRGG